MLVRTTRKLPGVSKTPRVKATVINPNPGNLRVTVTGKSGVLVLTVPRLELNEIMDKYPDARIKVIS